jgi:WD40 repeat protein
MRYAGVVLVALGLLLPATAGAQETPHKALVCDYSVRVIALSPDGKLLAAGEEPPLRPAAIRVWHFPSGRPAFTLRGHKHVVCGLAFHPSKPLLVSTSYDGVLACWDVRKGRKVGSVFADKSFFYPTFVGQNDTLLVSPVRRPPEFWDVADPGKIKLSRRQPLREQPRGGVDAVSPDRTLHVAAFQNARQPSAVVVRGVSRGNKVLDLTGPWSTPGSVCFSPDGKTFAVGFLYPSMDGSIVRLWEVASGRQLASFRGPKLGVQALAFSPDGRLLVSGEKNGDIFIWEVKTGKKLLSLYAHSDDVKGLLFSPDGKFLVSASEDDSVKIWVVKDILPRPRK